MAKNNASIIDPEALIAAGIDPKTGLPIKYIAAFSGVKKEEIKKQLRILDEQDAVNRYVWHNLPEGLNGKLMERILYYRGQAMMFYLDGKFYFLPFALDGSIDVYGRFESVTPLPFNGTAQSDTTPYIQGLTYNPIYDVQLPEDFAEKSEEEIIEFLENSCVIFKDYTEQQSQTVLSRQILNEPILDFMAECFPFMRTALINATGVSGMRVNTENESANVYAANNAIVKAALEGNPKVPIVGNVDFQELTGSAPAKAEEFLLAMQSLDNYRLSLYGLENGGLFQKKSHMLEAEQAMNSGNVGLVMRDGLSYRQMQATIANSIWGTNMWVEVSETTINMDTTGDGVAGDNEEEFTEESEDEFNIDE
jgi:hypothetical protein